MTIKKNDVVQFTDQHIWCGCLGIVTKLKEFENDTRYMVGVPMPGKGTAFVFVMESKNEIERIGEAHFVLGDDDE